jgi:sugar porter (SP) family MFS transporter
LIFIVGGACQTFATGMPMMMLGRIIAGLGVGALTTIVPVYQSEISPPHNRGKLACIEFSGNIFGYMVSVWVDYGCSYIESDWAWRAPLAMQVFMGSLLAVGTLLVVESPRWLLDNDHDEEGIVVIANLYGKGDIHNPKARDEYREIKMSVLLQRQEGERSYADMFKRYYKRVFIAMSAQALAQLNGINVISYYAPLVFEQAGWRGRDALLMTGINGVTYLLSTVPPWYLVDRLGRRFILLSGALAMMITLSGISYFMYIDIAATPTLVVVFVMLYNASFGFSWGPIPWLYPPEILPMSIRAKGASLSTAANWTFNWLVGEVTPILQDAIHWRLYLVHAFWCAVSFIVGEFSQTICTVRRKERKLTMNSSLVHLPRNRQCPSRGHELPLRRRHHDGTDSRDPRRSRVALRRRPFACAFVPPRRRRSRRFQHRPQRARSRHRPPCCRSSRRQADSEQRLGA